MKYQIPFNKPHFAGPEIEYITDALASGHLSGDGQFTHKCSRLLEEELGAAKALLTTSCTHALEMAAILLQVSPGDEVIMPSFTFVSTANAFVLQGARPVFVDIRSDNFNIDERLIEERITSRTKAIVPVHYAGIGCNMEEICSIASKHKIAIVEDNAHGLFAKYNNKYLGTFGALATQSFHETKNFQCGEGGALIVNDECLVERAEIIREKGTDRKKFFRGQVDKYSWVDVGSSYLPSEILAAILFAQLEKRNHLQACRKAIWDHYAENLSEWADREGIRIPSVCGEQQYSHHIFYLLMNSIEDRQALSDLLRSYGIAAVHHYVPLHSSKMGMQFNKNSADLPVTNYVSDRLLRLPLYNSLSSDEQDKVISVVLRFKTSRKEQPDLTSSLARP